MSIISPYPAQPSRTGAPATPAQATGATSEPADTFVAAPDDEPEVQQLSTLHKVAVFGSLALAGLGAAPLAARAQVPTPPPTSQSQARVASTLGSSLHLTPQGSARVAHDPALAQQLRSMSDLTRDMYQSYTPAQKDLLYKALSGSTRVGFSVVDHQEAFITGRALGRNAFPTIWNHVERKCQSEGLSDVESKQLKDHFLVLTTLPQAERAAFAALVLADQAPAAQ